MSETITFKQWETVRARFDNGEKTNATAARLLRYAAVAYESDVVDAETLLGVMFDVAQWLER